MNDVLSFIEVAVLEQIERDSHDATCICDRCDLRRAVEMVAAGDTVGRAEMDDSATTQRAIDGAKKVIVAERHRKNEEIARAFAAIRLGRRRRK